MMCVSGELQSKFVSTLYHYGKDINISELRRIDYKAYKNMCMVGGVSHFRELDSISLTIESTNILKVKKYVR